MTGGERGAGKEACISMNIAILLISMSFVQNVIVYLRVR
jgi:hypothetical protein